MSYAIKALRDYLAKSPSVIYPADVMEYLPAIEAENGKLREMVRDYKRCVHANCDRCEHYGNLSTHCPLSSCFPDADELCETYDPIKNITLSEMYRQGYIAGSNNAWGEAHLEMKRLRDCLRAILSRGEAPAHVMSDEERITDARSVPHHL